MKTLSELCSYKKAFLYEHNSDKVFICTMEFNVSL